MVTMEEEKRKELLGKCLDAVTSGRFNIGGGDLVPNYITSKEICELCAEILPDITIEEVTEYMFLHDYQLENMQKLAWVVYEEVQ